MNNINNISWQEAKDLFRTWRENNERKSEDVVYIWKAALECNLNKLGNEKQLVVEQVCVAALDCHQLDIAEFCVRYLSKEFPYSLRVEKYKSMILEAQERYEEALDILENIISADKTNSAARKRIVAIFKAQGRNVEAIKQLTEYLKTYMTDTEAWQELSELYIAEQDFQKAAFCVEELILHSPHNHLLHQRYADIRYTQGGTENMELARAYYCQALKLNPNNMRALYGLYLATSNMATSSKYPSQKKKEASNLSEWALTEIKQRYKEKKVANIEDYLAVLQIS
ncbi:Tetratricopeptide repeat-containing protein [Oryctes borbonicus]|uniref:ER membrane protein complex subunit 2 n=1 Tax=Oryctes borbonicus TaxID=1629725 RepID=A0A0T6AW84_9SCAR|nr:Tetratricopeptide repeat-containing protein [Oryctes borbonicus]